MKHRILLGDLTLIVCLFSSFNTFAALDREVTVSMESRKRSWKHVIPYPDQNLLVMEVDASLPLSRRQVLLTDLKAAGFKLLPQRPVGFPNAGSPQTTDQTLWAVSPPKGFNYAQSQARLRETASLSRENGLLGMLPAYKSPTDSAYSYFRPAHFILMVDPAVPYEDINAKLTSYPWIQRIEGELESPVLTKYVLKKVVLRVDDKHTVFEAIDTLSALSWVSWAAPIRLNWKENLPFADIPELVDRMATGNLSKLRTRDLIQVAHAWIVDGPEIAEIVAKSQMGVDENLNFRVAIMSKGAYDRVEARLISNHVSILSHTAETGSPGEVTRTIADVPFSAVASLTEIEEILSVETQPRSVINTNFEQSELAPIDNNPDDTGGPTQEPESQPQGAAPCWPNSGCTPSCVSQGVGLSGIPEWQQLGINGSGIKIGIIDDFDKSSLDTAVYYCALSSNVLSSTFHYDSRVRTPLITYTMAHGVEVATGVSQMAPCAQLYLAEPNWSDVAALLNDIRGIRIWMRNNAVQVVNVSFSIHATLQADGSDALSAILDSMVTVDGMKVVVAAGNERRWHHEKPYTSYGNIRYPSTYSAPVYQPGTDAYHNVTNSDDDLSSYLYHGRGTPNLYLQWRDRQFTGIPTKWWFEMVYTEGPNDDAINFLNGDAVAVSIRNVPYDTPDPINGIGLDAWVGRPIPSTTTWSNWNEIGLSGGQTAQSPGGYYHLMIFNGIQQWCESSTYQFAFPVTCGGNAPDVHATYTLELLVDFPSNQMWQGFQEPNPSRNPPAYNDTGMGTLVLSPATAKEVLCAGAYDITASDLRRVNYSVSGPICSVFTAMSSPERPHVLGPTSVQLPLRWGVFSWCGGQVNGTSIAAPHVAGAVALMMTLFPGITTKQIIDSFAAWRDDQFPFEAPKLNLVNWHLYNTAKGDENCTGGIGTSDVIYLVNFIFKGGPAPCAYWDNADMNCNGVANSADIVYLSNYVLKGGPPPVLCL